MFVKTSIRYSVVKSGRFSFLTEPFLYKIVFFFVFVFFHDSITVLVEQTKHPFSCFLIILFYFILLLLFFYFCFAWQYFMSYQHVYNIGCEQVRTDIIDNSTSLESAGWIFLGSWKKLNMLGYILHTCATI